MKKRKTKQQKVIDKTFEHVYSLLTIAESAVICSVADRFHIHHLLLDMIPTVETVLNGNGFTRTDEVTQRIKSVDEMVAPASNLECFK